MPTNQIPSLSIDAALLKEAALVYRAANNKLRQNIMRLIQKNEKIIVSEIYKKLQIEQSVASQHLAILRRARFVNTQRDGKFIYYSINADRLRQVADIAIKLNSGIGK